MERDGIYVIRGPGEIYAGQAENFFVAQRWVRLLTAIEEEVRQAMFAGEKEEVRRLLDRVEWEARRPGDAEPSPSDQQAS